MEKMNYYIIFVTYEKDKNIESFMTKKTPLSLEVMESKFSEIFEKISKDKIRNIKPITKEQFESIGEVDYFACKKSMELKYEENRKQKRKEVINGLMAKLWV